jgi:hypothetical protein
MTSQELYNAVLEDARANPEAIESVKPSETPPERSRLYQLEMFKASMDRNIVVVVVLLHHKHISVVLTLEADGYRQWKNPHVIGLFP